MSAGFCIPASNISKKARRNGARARRRPEDDLQKCVCQYLDILQHQGRLRYFAVPNGGKRSKIESAIMKGLGTKSGVPDLVILPKHGNAMFVELKSADGTTTDNQEAWIGWLTASGYAVAVCRSLEEVIEFLTRKQVIPQVAA